MACVNLVKLTSVDTYEIITNSKNYSTITK